MAEPVIDRDIDDDSIQRAVLIDELSQLRGRFHVTITKKRRSSGKVHVEQHGYYRAGVLPVVRRFLNETQGGMPDGDGYRDFTEDEAHGWAKLEAAKEGAIGKPIADKRTGEITAYIVPSCADMNVYEMWRFTNAVIERMARERYKVPPPRPTLRSAVEQAVAESKNRPGRAA